MEVWSRVDKIRFFKTENKVFAFHLHFRWDAQSFDDTSKWVLYDFHFHGYIAKKTKSIIWKPTWKDIKRVAVSNKLISGFWNPNLQTFKPKPPKPHCMWMKFIFKSLSIRFATDSVVGSRACKQISSRLRFCRGFQFSLVSIRGSLVEMQLNIYKKPFVQEIAANSITNEALNKAWNVLYKVIIGSEGSRSRWRRRSSAGSGANETKYRSKLDSTPFDDFSFFCEFINFDSIGT